jgi:hypothetical protein
VRTQQASGHYFLRGDIKSVVSKWWVYNADGLREPTCCCLPYNHHRCLPKPPYLAARSSTLSFTRSRMPQT